MKNFRIQRLLFAAVFAVACTFAANTIHAQNEGAPPPPPQEANFDDEANFAPPPPPSSERGGAMPNPNRPRPSIEERAKRFADKVTQVCALAPEQTEALRKARFEMLNKMDGTVKRKTANPAQQPNAEEARNERRELHQEWQKRVKAILTPEQFERFRQYHNPEGGQRPPRRDDKPRD